MNTIELSVDEIGAPDWNPNQMDAHMRSRLTNSITRFGLVVPIVVRRTSGFGYETVGGAQRLAVLRELGIDPVPCVLVNADDSEAGLLAQALNRIQGQDDLGLRAESLRRILEKLPQSEVLSILPETADSLKDLASLGMADLSEHLQAWQAAQAARLKHLTFQLVPDQLTVVEQAIEIALSGAIDDVESANPNRRGNGLFHLCRDYLESRKAATP